ncbi:hypothetical protein CV015_14710, partial [Staphylococcus haemolyticus]
VGKWLRCSGRYGMRRPLVGQERLTAGKPVLALGGQPEPAVEFDIPRTAGAQQHGGPRLAKAGAGGAQPLDGNEVVEVAEHQHARLDEDGICKLQGHDLADRKRIARRGELGIEPLGQTGDARGQAHRLDRREHVGGRVVGQAE